jgi:hypothetical protein
MWADLPLDVSNLILDLLPDSDVGRLSLACKNWRAAVHRWLHVDERYIELSVIAWTVSGGTHAFRYLLYHPSNRVTMERWFIIVDRYRREYDAYEIPEEPPLRDLILDRFCKEPQFIVRMVRIHAQLIMPITPDLLERYIVENSRLSSQSELDDIILNILWNYHDPYRFFRCFDLLLQGNEDLHIFDDIFKTHTQYGRREGFKRWVKSHAHSQKRKRIN